MICICIYSCTISVISTSVYRCKLIVDNNAKFSFIKIIITNIKYITYIYIHILYIIILLIDLNLTLHINNCWPKPVFCFRSWAKYCTIYIIILEFIQCYTILYTYSIHILFIQVYILLSYFIHIVNTHSKCTYS